MIEIGLPMACRLLVLLTLSATVDGLSRNQTSSGDPFVFTYSPTKVYPGFTSNVELRCARDTAVDTSMKELLWLRILKHTLDKGWVVVAEQKEGESQVDDATSSTLTPVSQAYLSVVWTETTESMLGSYKCLSLGLDEHLSFVAGETSQLEIKAKKVAEADLLNIILDTDESIRASITANAGEISNATRTVDIYSRHCQKRYKTVNERLDQANLAADAIIANILFPDMSQMWPAGTYGLLKPEVGCPEDFSFYDGTTGFFRFHAESSTLRSDNRHSKNTHLSRPIFTSYSTNSFMTLRFCMTNGLYNSGADWPNGRYCIHKKGSCPSDFQSGIIYAKTESWGNLDRFGGLIPDTSPTAMYFCCRTDGNPTTPIVLPTNHPFYLYQYDGRCQQVKDMKVTEEYIQLDTEPGSSGNSYHPYLPGDSSGDILRLELCYYTNN